MEKSLHKEALKTALAQKGWTQGTLAREMGVTPQAVTNWLKGVDFPRPDKLLKLATLLHLSFDQLIQLPQANQPVVAFRKRAGTKTTDVHIQKAQEMGLLLKTLVPFLPEISRLRALIPNPSTDYAVLQQLAMQVRGELGVGDLAVLGYEQIIGKFKASGGVLIPVLWGHKQRHENALHILLPDEDVTFVFLNLDVKLEDFKFWMAHELAHVYTPQLAGTNEGEDFADALAGAVLFPQACAEAAYRDALHGSANHEIAALLQHANKHQISLNTVFQQTRQYASARGLTPLRTPEDSIHAVRNSVHAPLVSSILFDPMPPTPAHYVAASANVFQSDFFKALERAINENGSGASYVQQILDIPLQDAMALHRELSR